MPCQKNSFNRSYVGARELPRQLDQLGVAPPRARAHDLVITGGVELVVEHQVVAVGGEQLLVGEAHRLQRVFALLRVRAPRDSRQRHGGEPLATL